MTQLLSMDILPAPEQQPTDGEITTICSSSSPVKVTLSPVAARKQHFETIFQKSAPSLMSPSEFRRPSGSLVKKRHSWLKEDSTKPLPLEQKQQFKSPFLRRLMAKRSSTPTEETDVTKSQVDGGDEEEGRDEVDDSHAAVAREEFVEDESPMKDTTTAIDSPMMESRQSEEHHQKVLEEGIGADSQGMKSDKVVVAAFPKVLSAPMEEIEITVPSSSCEEVQEGALDVSLLETDERGEDVATVEFRCRQKEQAVLRRQLQQELETAQGQSKPLKAVGMIDQTIAAESLVPVITAEAAEPQNQIQALTAKRSSSNEYDEWQVVRVNSQSCEATCLDGLSCAIL